jgi:nicotinamidase-related amidase
MRKLLIVVDMQKDFIDGSLGTAEAQAIVEPLIQLVKEYDPKDIIATRDTHPENYMETQEGRNLPVPHCIRGTDGWQIRPEIAALLFPDHVIDKPTFGSTQLAKLMEILERREEDGIEIELVGLCTDICVVSNALLLKASMPETPISCDASCCAGVTPAKHEAALETMRSCQIKILNA